MQILNKENVRLTKLPSFHEQKFHEQKFSQKFYEQNFYAQKFCEEKRKSDKLQEFEKISEIFLEVEIIEFFFEFSFFLCSSIGNERDCWALVPIMAEIHRDSEIRKL